MRNLVLALILTTATASASAQTSAPRALTQPATPDVGAAIQHLSSDDYTTRQRALAELENSLARQIERLAIVPDPEGAARAAEALKFEEMLARWTVRTAGSKTPEAANLIKWGLRPQHVAMIATLEGADGGGIKDALTQLAAQPDPEAATVIANYLRDSDKEHFLPAVDALWDAKLSDAALDTLFIRCKNAMDRKPAMLKQTDFQGEHFHVGSPNAFFMSETDVTSEAAAKLLAHVHSSHTAETVAAFAKTLDGKNIAPTFISGQDAAGVMMTLFSTFKTREAIPYLYAKATGQRWTTMSNNADFSSNRTAALGILLEITGQNLKEYGVYQSKLWNGTGSWATHTQQGEDAAVEKLTKWWERRNAKEQTAPARGPAAAP